MEEIIGFCLWLILQQDLKITSGWWDWVEKMLWYLLQQKMDLAKRVLGMKIECGLPII